VILRKSNGGLEEKNLDRLPSLQSNAIVVLIGSWGQTVDA